MEIQNRYNIYLDYKGFMVDRGAANVSAAPLMGNIFSTGRSNYSDLDFWQVGAATDFSHGMNQKFIVDPSAYYLSLGIDVSEPGEIKLERDLVTSSMPQAPEGGWGTVTATYRSSTHLWIGTSIGYVFYRKTGDASWTRETSITADSNKIYDFFEIRNPFGDGKLCLFVTKGPIKGYVRIGTTGSFVQIAPDVEWALPLADMYELGVGGTSMPTKITQSFIVNANTSFKKLSIAYKSIGSYAGNIRITIRSSNAVTGEPETDTLKTFDVTASGSASTMTWLEKTFENGSELNLKRCLKYFIEIEPLVVTSSSYPEFGATIGSDSYYEGDTTLEWNSVDSTWDTMEKQEQTCFRLWSDLRTDVYYVDSNSNYVYGWVEDGIKSTANGMAWSPETNDGLWTMPANQGTPVNVTRTVRGLLVGGISSLWLFLGGTSGVRLWNFPEYSDSNNFKGMHQYDQVALFSVEKQGIYITDGSSITPTNLNSLKDIFKFESCAGITSSGTDAFAVIKDTGGNWYLARSNASYTGSHSFWWLVKKLSKVPVNIAALDGNTIYIFYSDETSDIYQKNGAYVQSGTMETSLFDANLVKLDKFFRSVNGVLEPFPSGTSVSLGYRTSTTGTYTNSSNFTSGSYISYSLPNPTVANRLQAKVTLNTNSSANATPVLTDLTWTYVLTRSTDTSNTLKNFHLTLLGQDNLQLYTGEVDRARTTHDITDELWAISQKKQILNYVGLNNKCEVGLVINYSGTAGKTMTIDRTNFLLTISGSTLSYNYKNKTLTDVAEAINALTNFSCTVHVGVDSSRTAHDLEPILKQPIEIGEQYINVGSDIHAVLMSSNSPNQTILSVDGRGSDRMNVSLREVED